MGELLDHQHIGREQSSYRPDREDLSDIQLAASGLGDKDGAGDPAEAAKAQR
ncbi:hypothetical protein [Muricoccus vinaceus]|uniref:Uncharacterized protein n=1 Tax=Muricoccus vinaceus TaxID=424704 RepID=A0ABV6IQE6_9PROT